MSTCEHVELATDDPTRARDFYAALFRWTIDSTPDGHGGEYLMFRTANGGGGITAKMAPGQPTAWMPYFTVPSVKATLAAADKLGASVQLPYTSIGEMGAIAVLSDPTGAAFGLWETVAAPAKQPAAPAKQAAAKAKKPVAKAKKAAPPAKKAAAPAKKAAAPAKKPAAKKSAPRRR